ncbi:MAG: TetR family transcriptional regulator [Pseudonocardiaceae bacterium]|nr:TetR family transcriptional regulator [Pseudonocardiaceae bacterium]
MAVDRRSRWDRLENFRAPPRSDMVDFAAGEPNGALGAALAEFAVHGYHGTTVRRIAKRAGLSAAGLYHHYQSKQDMLVAVMNRGLDDLTVQLESEVEHVGTDPVDRLVRIVEVLALFHTQRTKEAFVAWTEVRSLEPANRGRVVAKRDRIQRLADAAVEDGVASGAFLNEFPRDSSRFIASMCVSIVQWYKPDGPLSPSEVAERLVVSALRLAGYAPDSGAV